MCPGAPCDTDPMNNSKGHFTFYIHQYISRLPASPANICRMFLHLMAAFTESAFTYIIHKSIYTWKVHPTVYSTALSLCPSLPLWWDAYPSVPPSILGFSLDRLRFTALDCSNYHVIIVAVGPLYCQMAMLLTRRQWQQHSQVNRQEKKYSRDANKGSKCQEWPFRHLTVVRYLSAIIVIF